MTILNPGKPRRLTAEFYTEDGKPARVDGSPVWAVSNPDVAELVPTLSDFAVRVRAKAPGTCEVTATADADLSEGVREMVLRAVLVVPEPEAATGSLVIGEEEDEPAPTPVDAAEDLPPAPEPEPVPEPVPEPTPEPVVAEPAPEPVASDDPAHDGPAFPDAPAVEEAAPPAAEEVKPDIPGDPAPPPTDRPTE